MTPATSLSEALQDHFEAIAERDIDRFSATLSADDLRLVGGEGRIIHGRDNAVAAHRDWFADARWTFEPEILWMREEATAGWVLTRVRYTDAENERQFLLLLIFMNEDGAWKLVYDQNTPIA